MDKCIIFIPYGSRLGFHQNGIASTMANIDYKFPQCVCYEEKSVRSEASHRVRTQISKSQPAICYEKPSSCNVYVMSERQISMMITEDVSNTIAATDFKGSQVVCYEQCKMPEPMGSAEQTTVSD